VTSAGACGWHSARLLELKQCVQQACLVPGDSTSDLVLQFTGIVPSPGAGRSPNEPFPQLKGTLFQVTLASLPRKPTLEVPAMA
jgi:hypothetical protein